jgi:hypothetical protein
MEAARSGLKDVSEHLTKSVGQGAARGQATQDGRSLGGGGLDSSLFRQQEVTSSEIKCFPEILAELTVLKTDTRNEVGPFSWESQGSNPCRSNVTSLYFTQSSGRTTTTNTI